MNMNDTRVAVPSDDGRTVAYHFGRARGFLLFDIAGGAATLAGYRPAPVHPGPDRMHHGAHHRETIEAMAGCSAVIARGMGVHMRQDLAARHIEVAITDVDDAAAAVALWISSMLPESEECGCVKPPHCCI